MSKKQDLKLKELKKKEKYYKKRVKYCKKKIDEIEWDKKRIGFIRIKQ